MKRFLTILCVICVVCSLCACNKNDTTETTDTTNQSISQEPGNITLPSGELIPFNSDGTIFDATDLVSAVKRNGDIKNFTLELTRSMSNTYILYTCECDAFASHIVYAEYTYADGKISYVTASEKYYDVIADKLYVLDGDSFKVYNEDSYTKSLSEMCDNILTTGFFNKLAEALHYSKYNAKTNEYSMKEWSVASSSETFLFENGTLVLDEAFNIVSFSDTTGPQSTSVNISKIGSTVVNLPKNISENSSETP